MVSKKERSKSDQFKGKLSTLLMADLEREAKKQKSSLSALIDAVRFNWLSQLPTKSEQFTTRAELIRICESAAISVPVANQKLAVAAAKLGLNNKIWQNRDFSGRFRFHLPPGSMERPQQEKNRQLFFELFGRRYRGKESEIIKTLKGYDLSIRPLNFSSAIFESEAIENFLPGIGQKFETDPFGVQRREHLVVDEEKGKLIYLATRKKEHGTYLTILRTVSYCAGGCANCYRGHQTREIEMFKAINPDGTQTDVYFLAPVEQVDRLVRVWNKEKNPPDDILFSGGEPMDIGIKEWERIFKILRGAKHLRFLRICTGDLFLGEPFRISDPEFLRLLKQWYEDTGKPIKFATNLPHPAFITPEAVRAILCLHKLGIGVEIQTQTMMPEGILCFQKEIEQKICQLGKKEISDKKLIDAWAPSLARSSGLLREMFIKIAMVSDRPYKLIHDMQKSVSVIYSMVLFSLLSEPHVGTTDSAVRPTSLAIFTPKSPNLNVSFHTLQYLANTAGAYQEDNGTIKMLIPHAVGEIVEYVEPLWQGINNKSILQRIANINFWKKLREEVKSYKCE